VTQVCAADPYCCTSSWDSQCVGEVATYCGVACPSSCAHSECVTGAALTDGCSACVSAVCAVDFFCCFPFFGSWDASCVDEAEFVCGLNCP
jgi:hypothetical protein